MKTFFASLCLFLGSLFSCQQKTAGFKSVSAEEFASLIAAPKVQRLDVRTTAEYAEGHIPGSLNADVLGKQFETEADSLLQKDRPVALYCRSGRRSKKAAGVLSRKGYEVYELRDGFQGWLRAGKEVERGQP